MEPIVNVSHFIEKINDISIKKNKDMGCVWLLGISTLDTLGCEYVSNFE